MSERMWGRKTFIKEMKGQMNEKTGNGKTVIKKADDIEWKDKSCEKGYKKNAKDSE